MTNNPHLPYPEMLASVIEWKKTQEDPFIFQAMYRGKLIRLRLNDFPEEPLCTLILDGSQTDLDDFPPSWSLPRHRGET